MLRRLFEQKKKKKKQGSCPECPYDHPESNCPNVRKFTRKKKVNFDAFLAPVGQAERSTLRVRMLFPEVFFITGRKKTHYCNHDLLYNRPVHFIKNAL
jgi:hypothetical protein